MIEGFDRCIRCGLCLQSCPTYLETMTETSGPRGRITLMAEVAGGRLPCTSPGFVEQMSQCLGCLACEEVCPSGVPYGAMLEGARAVVEAAQAPLRSPAARRRRHFLLITLFTHLSLLRLVAAGLRLAQRLGLDHRLERLGLVARLGLENAAALAPRLPERPFRARNQRIEVPGSRTLAFLHVGCIMPLVFPSVHEATLRVLPHAGCACIVPNDQGCCGAIALHSGEPEAARRMAQSNIEAFERSGAQSYVVNAAGCGAALKEYGRLFADDPAWAKRAERFSACVSDICEFLDAGELDPLGSLEFDVTYQDACHLGHAQRIHDAPRRLLARIPGLRLVEQREAELCCGSAGLYNLLEPAMAARLGERKVRNIIETRASVVATANPGCSMQMDAGLRAAGARVRVAHVVELLDDAYRSYEAGTRSRSASASSNVR
ncbi:MAG: (Fe-S)-binding protein [Vulcanimicrobiaceae bacterium]